MKKLSLLTILFCLFLSQVIFAQANLHDPLPKDPKTVVGKLSNGITYYLRHNKEPKGQASFYIIRNAGALLEEPEQNGLAHFLEHMAFQGTKNFPGKGIISTLEKYGVAFGSDINAYTSHNETVYNISSVPTDNDDLLDTCLMILHDWSYYLLLEEDEIDAERGVISEEWRTRRNAGFRMRAQMMPIVYKGSKYAERDVIGSLDVIKNFKPETIRDFYHKWYRTDLEAVAIVGDFDVKKMEERVKAILSSVPAVKNPTPRPFFAIPEHEEMYYGLVTDKEATSSSVSITTIMPAASAQEKNTHAYVKDNIISAFYNAMVSARIGELLHQENPPFLGGSFGFGAFVRGYNYYSISTTAKPNEEAIALETILTENERVLRHGFTQSELDRVKTNTLVGLESSYKDKDLVDNESHISKMQANFLEGEPIIEYEYYYQFVKQLIPTITVEEVNAKAKEWNITKNRSLIVSGPSEGVKHLSEEECLAIIEKVKKSEITPYKDTINERVFIKEELKGSKVVKSTPLPQFEAVEWTLENGAKVVFRKADYEKDAVALSSYSEGGTSLYGVDKLVSAQNTASFVGAFGLGDFDAISLGKVLTGKMASTGVKIASMSESVQGTSTPQDVETMLQMIYLRFEKPRFDEEIFKAVLNRNRSTLPMVINTPQKLMQDSIKMIMSNYSPRTLLYNEDYLNKLSLKQIEEVYRDRFKDASDFTFFIVGNVEEETIKPLVEKYIGSIKSEYRKETWKDTQVRGPKGKTVREIEVKLEVPKSTVITKFSNDLKYSTFNNFCLTILEGILDLRYTDNIREKEGGTYGVSVSGSVLRIPYNNYSLSMSFDCDPDKAAHLKSLIYAELEKIKKEAPTKEELQKVVSNLMKGREESKNHNSYWLSAIASYYINGVNPADPKNYEDILNRITPKDIQKFTKALMKGADIVDITFKPKSE